MRQEGERRRGQKRRKAEGTLTLLPLTFRSQRYTSQTSRIKLKDFVIVQQNYYRHFFPSRIKWEFISGHFMLLLKTALQHFASALASC